MSQIRFAALASALTAASFAHAAADEPRVQDGTLVYQQDAAIGKALTTIERDWIRTHPIIAETDGRSLLSAPVGSLVCPPEYVPSEGIIFSYRGLTGWLNIVEQMVAEVTTTGDATAWVAVPSINTENLARSEFIAAGADMSRVQFVRTFTDTIWMRDYGPRFVFEGGVRVIVDHTYNRPRPNDNNFPSFFANQEDHHRYLLPLVHGGGNYHLFNNGEAYATDLIEDENPTRTRQQIINFWNDYQGVDTNITDALPATIDATQHIDMWMIPISDDAVIVSDWPLQSGSIQDQICDAYAQQMIDAGKTVYRTPARTRFGTHYTYTNAVICNDLVLVPKFSGVGAASFDSDALAVWQAALPDKTIAQIECQAIVTAAGVMHCIVKHVPAASNGSDPIAYMQTLRESQVLTGGSTVSSSWISDDAEGITSVSLDLSLDNGASWTTLGTNLDDDGDLSWSVPNISTVSALVRVRAFDADSNVGIDTSVEPLTIEVINPTCPADISGGVVAGLGDGAVDISDLLYLLSNFNTSGHVNYTLGDVTGDGTTDISDLLNLLSVFNSNCQ